MPLLSEISFGALAVYSPRGLAKVSVSSRRFCEAVKMHGTVEFSDGSEAMIPRMIRKMRERIADTELADFFAGDPVLVPAPRSSLLKKGSLFPTKVICEELVKQGFGSQVQVLLERERAVRKAATAPTGERPTVSQHYNSLVVVKELAVPDSILVVDDVITSGAMLVASVSRLQNLYPKTQIRAFALIRTMSQGEIERFYEICTGSVVRRDEWCSRNP